MSLKLARKNTKPTPRHTTVISRPVIFLVIGGLCSQYALTIQTIASPRSSLTGLHASSSGLGSLSWKGSGFMSAPSRFPGFGVVLICWVRSGKARAEAVSTLKAPTKPYRRFRYPYLFMKQREPTADHLLPVGQERHPKSRPNSLTLNFSFTKTF